MPDHFISLAGAARVASCTTRRILSEVAKGRIRTLCRPGEPVRYSSIDSLMVSIDPDADPRVWRYES